MRKGQIILSVILAIFVLVAVTNTVWADSTDPLPPLTLESLSSSRMETGDISVQYLPAEAGNISHLNISGISVTKTWQGFVGNVSGTLVLRDADNNTMYDWTVAEPKGEVYASVNNSITWTGVACFDHTTAGGDYNSSIIELAYGVDYTDDDGIDETFNTVTHPAFQVGTTAIAVDSCPSTETYVNNATQTTRFHEMLLNDGTGEALIFATILENDQADNATDIVGFDGVEHDFQMLVIEDGHDGEEDATTNYYFWIEIE